MIERRGFHLFVAHALELAVVSVLQTVTVAAEVLIVGRQELAAVRDRAHP